MRLLPNAAMTVFELAGPLWCVECPAASLPARARVGLARWVGARLSQLGWPVGSFPVPEDEVSPAASVTLLLFYSSSRACVGRDLCLRREFF